MTRTQSLIKARSKRAQNAERAQKAEIKAAAEWSKALREEVQRRADYNEASEPRERERARKAWRHAYNAWLDVPIPSDEALKIAKDMDRSDQ